MILLLKLLSTTTMSSDSAGESVPSWLRPEKESDGEPTGSERLVGGSRDSSRDCRMRRGRFSTRSPVNLVDFIGASFPHLQDPGARVCLQLEVPLRGGTRETHSVGELWWELHRMRNIQENTWNNNNTAFCSVPRLAGTGFLHMLTDGFPGLFHDFNLLLPLHSLTYFTLGVNLTPAIKTCRKLLELILFPKFKCEVLYVCLLTT